MNAHVFSMLRQRPPFLFVNAYRPLDDGAGIEATFRFHGDEPYFDGHFPGEPVVPGVLLVEAMAQAARVALAWRYDRVLPGYLASVEKARFNKPVRPPEEVRLIARLASDSDQPPVGFAEASCSVFIGKARAARADLKLSIQNL